MLRQSTEPVGLGLCREREAEIDRAIVDGYRRIPPTAEEERWAEPWLAGARSGGSAR